MIHSTFRALIPASTPLPQPLIPNLLSRFSSSEGYKLYPDVLPFFHALRESKQVVDQGAEKAVPSNFGVGVVTNSDDRVPLVLSSLGLEIGSSRHRLLKTPSIESSNDEDIKFVVMSYDVGSEKPDREIFDAARALGSVNGGFENECLHVGDDVQKDYQGAKDAGWNSLLLDRGHRYNPKKIPLLSNLDELRAILF